MRLGILDTRSGLEDGIVLGTVDGRTDLPSWADDDNYKALVSAIHEVDRDGKHYTYLHCQEIDTSIRVDFDRDGWQRLRDLCNVVLTSDDL